MRVLYDVMFTEFQRVLLKYGFTPERAELCARLFAEASRDGVYTHGLNRFPRFINNIRGGLIDVQAEPSQVEVCGALERWDGRMGPGNLNAWFCMDRAVQIAKNYGIGCVAIRNTHHWMRPGAYGLQAADAGCIGLCWTNTIPNLPPWGAKEAKLGNNPIVMAVPRSDGNHVVLDMAMSMFSYGKLESYARRGEPLPVDGGFDANGRLTRDAGAVMETQRPLPIGYWKGSGLSLLLDLVAMILSGGNSAYQIGKLENEIGLSQTFIAMDITKLSGADAVRQSIEATLADLRQSTPTEAGGRVYYPGERMMRAREDNLKNGIPVDEEYWNEVLGM